MVAVNMRRPPAWQCLFEQLRSSWIGSPFRIGLCTSSMANRLWPCMILAALWYRY